MRKILKSEEISLPKIWGSEDWLISTMDGNESKTDGTPLSQAIGGKYRLLVKRINAKETLSVQVHPDDEVAKQLEAVPGGEIPCGKTECWLVLAAQPDAELILGLSHAMDEAEMRSSIENGRLDAAFKRVEVRPGDFIFVPAGTIHAIGGGLTLLEVQQACDTTYRLSDWGRGRKCDVEKSVAAIFGSEKIEPRVIKAMDGKFECRQFSFEVRRIDNEESEICGGSCEGEFCGIFVVEGKIFLKADEEFVEMKAGDCALLDAKCRCTASAEGENARIALWT